VCLIFPKPKEKHKSDPELIEINKIHENDIQKCKNCIKKVIIFIQDREIQNLQKKNACQKWLP